jgi:hypothetical protein
MYGRGDYVALLNAADEQGGRDDGGQRSGEEGVIG